MQAFKTPEMLTFNLPTEFLERLLEADISTTLIVCSTRTAFIQDLLACVPSRTPNNPPSNSPLEHLDEASLEHEPGPFLVPTIHLVATSSKIRLVYCHTLEHLRAFLSVFQAREHSPAAEASKSCLAILNPITLHYDTTEFSAQGLSGTFGLAVEVAAKTRHDLIICECEGVGDHDDIFRGTELWEMEVPLLNGTARFGESDRDWAGRMVRLKRVVERWFIFKTCEDDAPVDAMDI
jgi:hypothetical protein